MNLLNTKDLILSYNSKQFKTKYDQKYMSDHQLASLVEYNKELGVYDLRNKLPSIILTKQASGKNYSLKRWNHRKKISHIIIHQTISNSIVQDLHYYEAGQRTFDWQGKKAIVERIPYHFIISKNGYIFWINNLDRATWHTGSTFNTIGLGIGLVGKFNYGFPYGNIHYNEFSNTMDIDITPENTMTTYVPQDLKTIMRGTFPIKTINTFASLPSINQFQSLHRLIGLLLNNKIQDKDINLNLNKCNIRGHCECRVKPACPGAALIGYILGLRLNKLKVDRNFSLNINTGVEEPIKINDFNFLQYILETKSW